MICGLMSQKASLDCETAPRHGRQPALITALTEWVLVGLAHDYGQAYAEPLPRNPASWFSLSVSRHRTSKMAMPYRSIFHTVLVKLMLYMLVWPTILLHAFFTLPALIVALYLPLCVIGWWGLFSLLSLNALFAGKMEVAGRSTWLGLIAASILAIAFTANWAMKFGLDHFYWFALQVACIPTGAYWTWLAWRGFRF